MKTEQKILVRQPLVLNLMTEYLKFKNDTPSNLRNIYEQAIAEYAGENHKLESDINSAVATHKTIAIKLQDIRNAYSQAQ